MKHKKSGGFSKPTVSCMQETVLRQLVKVAGLQEMIIWRNRNKAWHLSVTVPQRSQILYLSTRRAPRDSGSGPPVKSRSCSGKQRTRLRHAQLHRTSPTRAALQGFLLGDPHQCMWTHSKKTSWKHNCWRA